MRFPPMNLQLPYGTPLAKATTKATRKAQEPLGQDRPVEHLAARKRAVPPIAHVGWDSVCEGVPGIPPNYSWDSLCSHATKWTSTPLYRNKVRGLPGAMKIPP